MNSYYIKGHRIMKLSIPEEMDVNTLQIGVQVSDDEAEKVGLKNVGDVVLPSSDFGPQSKKNAYGYTYADHSKEKERRYISTNWIYPFGNTNASMIPVDIYKECFPKVKVPPYEIELQLIENESNQLFVMVVMTDRVRKKYLKEAVNLLLEIYGVCFFFKDSIKIEMVTKKNRCNWEILPPGEMPSKHVERQLRENGAKTTDTYDIFRLNYLEEYKAEEIVEGVNGFNGYYAFVFEKYCVLESAVYGNATYIIPKENWKILSQKTKRELFAEKKVVARIEHTSKWRQNITRKLKELGISSIR